ICLHCWHPLAAPLMFPVLGRCSPSLTCVMIGVAIVLAGYFSASWIVWTGLMVAMLFMFGPRHPQVFDEHVPLDRTRLVLAGLALLMFILCFTPAPISELIRR